jgi:hypothetical protein
MPPFVAPSSMGRDPVVHELPHDFELFSFCAVIRRAEHLCALACRRRSSVAVVSRSRLPHRRNHKSTHLYCWSSCRSIGSALVFWLPLEHPMPGTD